MALELCVGDVVWTKMKGYPWWPAKIGKPKKDAKKPITKKIMHFVEFFGSKSYAWIPDELVKPYDQCKEELSKSSSNVKFRQALAEAEEYINKREESDSSSSSNCSMSDVPEAFHCYFSSPKSSPLLNYNSELSRRNTGVHCLPKASTLIKGKYFKKSHSRANGISVKRSAKTLSNQALKKRQMKKSEFSPSIRTARRRTLSEASNAGSATNNMDVDGTLVISESSTQSCDLLSPEMLTKAARRQERISPVVRPSTLKIGFLGLGNMGGSIVRNFVESGYKVTVWNRTQEKVTSFRETCEVDVGETPGDVVATSDIIFSCVSDTEAVQELVFTTGILSHMSKGKGYVEMTTIDRNTSRETASAIKGKGGKYLEAPIFGSKEYVAERQLIILAAGDAGLYDMCKPYFQTIARCHFFLGKTGSAAKMKLTLSMFVNTTLCALAEAMAFAKILKIPQDTFLDILECSPLRCPFFIDRGRAIISKRRNVVPMNHVLTDFNLVCQLGNKYNSPFFVAAAAYQIYKHAVRNNCDYHQMFTYFRSHTL